MNRQLIRALIFLALIASVRADTFTNPVTNKAYTGYAKSIDANGSMRVQSLEAGEIELNTSEYRVDFNYKGRNPFVSVIPIDYHIAKDIETQAFEEAIVEEAAKGPLLILIEVDTPGGRIDLTRRLCASISELRNAQTVAFIKGEKNLGAYSAGAAVSLACDKIYMAPNTAIGAATAIVVVGNKVKTEKEVFGEEIGEKFGSAWRNYLAALAQDNGRNGLLAKAMEDKDIIVQAINRNGQILYIEPQNRQPGDAMLEIFCKRGELLTLSPDKAVQCGIADGIVSSRSDILKELGIADADFVDNMKISEARKELDEVIERIEKVGDNLDYRFKALNAQSRNNTLTRKNLMKEYKKIIREVQYLIKLKDQYTDIDMEDDELQEFLNEIRAEYDSLKKVR